jgi:hypothetical protein
LNLQQGNEMKWFNVLVDRGALANRVVGTLALALVWSLGSLGSLGATSSAHAGVVNYCGVIGENVQFSNIVETSTGFVGPMYGQPISDGGDTLTSPGLGFLTQSLGGNLSLVDGRLQMTIAAENGFVFDELNVETLGSYFGLATMRWPWPTRLPRFRRMGCFIPTAQRFSKREPIRPAFRQTTPSVSPKPMRSS